jgi:hypothetical protein
MALLRRAARALCGLVTIVAAIAAVRHRLVLHIGAARLVSSHGVSKPALLAVLAGAAGWGLSTADERRTVSHQGARLLRRWLLATTGAAARLPAALAPALAAATAFAVITVGIARGTFVAGGSDSYGYVSEAHLLAQGAMRIEQPFVRDMTWPFAAESVAPLGYRPALTGTAIVPIYSSGLPMLMAVFERVAGREAVFYVVPLMGGLAVWMAYLMGAELGGGATGAAAAVLLATSPPFLIQLMAPMSDVPVAAWWAVALVLLSSERGAAAFAAGLAAGAATLTRPNLVVLAVVPGTLLLVRAVRERPRGTHAASRVVLFAAGLLPACGAVAVINAHLYGSPLASGYAPLSEMFRLENFLPNLSRYPRWLLQTETPLVALAALAPFLTLRGRDSRASRTPRRTTPLTWLCFVVAVFLCYVFYAPYDGWFWLRFVLPAFPPLFALMAATLTGGFIRFGRGPRIAATAVMVGALAWRGVAFSAREGVFDMAPGEQRAVTVSHYIARRLPERAALVSLHYSGSIRYYANRLTVRFDWIPDYRLDDTLEQLRGLGYSPYLVLEQWEEAEFRSRFAGHSALASLDWPPLAEFHNAVTTVKVFDPSARGEQTRRAPDVIH